MYISVKVRLCRLKIHRIFQLCSVEMYSGVTFKFSEVVHACILVKQLIS